MRFWGVIFFIFTIWLAVGKKEDAVSEDDPDMDVKKVYKVMWSIVRLKSGCLSISPTLHPVRRIRSYTLTPLRNTSDPQG